MPVSSGDSENAGGKATVLIVEDNPFFLKMQRIMLERAGFTVITAQDGRAGLELFDRFASQVDVVVTDLMMPEVNGVEVCRRIKERKADMPVVLVSGVGEEPEANTGFDAAMQKPFDPKDLIKLIATLIRPGARPAPGIAHGE